ncbi:MAG: ABC transporter substrate-binding protein [Eubacteriales bacterium]|nr:ABC transporter substrate-binding protein [Eubacteriales bacterium]
MKNRFVKNILCTALAAVLLTGCGASGNTDTAAQNSRSAASSAETAAGSESVNTAGEKAAAASSQEFEEVVISGSTGEVLSSNDSGNSSDGPHTSASIEAAPEIKGLTCESVMDLHYANQFNVFYYTDGYKLLDIVESGKYLLVPEGKEKPEGLDKNITVIQQPLTQVYNAATASMSLINAIGALDKVTMTSVDTSGWYIEAPKAALEDGKMAYAGKYSAPDYEQMVGKNCDLAIESTMILHSPEVQEMLEDLGMPVLIDRCSYEQEALGRCEWVKVYGAIFDKEKEAEAFFTEQEKLISQIQDYQATGKTVAFFSVNSNKSIVVRKTADFIPNMIALAGGEYIFENLENTESKSASVNVSMEEFYSVAKDADYLIYNGTIEAPLNTIEDLIGKDVLFEEFKAVKEGNVYQVDGTWYQSTDKVANLILDFHEMMDSGDDGKMTFLSKVPAK